MGSISANGGVEEDVSHRVSEGSKVLGTVNGVIRNRGLGMNVKKVLYEKVIVPTDLWIRAVGNERQGEKETECV